MSLKIWLPLINDLHNQGISNINATAVNTTIDSNGKTGGGCYFLSSASETNTSRIYTDLFTPTSNNFSMCCWYRANAENTDNGYLFGLSHKSEASLMLYKLGTTQFRLYINSYSAYTHNIDITQWHHLAITYDGITCKLYVDGIYKMQREQTIDYTQEEYRCFLNCRSSSSTTSGTGSVYGGDNYYNDFRFYDHCLSAAEVKEIAQGLILHYKLDDDYQYKWNLLNNTKYCTRENVRTNSWARGDVLSPGILQLTPTTATAYIRYVTEMDYKDWNNKTYTVSFDAQEIAAENEDYNVSSAIISYVGFMPVDRANSSVLISTAYDKFRRQDYDIKGEGWQHYSYTFTLPNVLNKGEDTALVDGSKFTVEFGKSASKKPLQIKNIKLELGNSDTGWMPSKTDMNLNENVIIDSSGYNHNGTITGTLSTDLSSAKHGAAIYCANGLTNYIDTPTLTLPTDNITLNIWFKSANDAPNDNFHIAVNSIGSSAGRNYYEMAIHKTGYFRGGLSINGQREAANCTSLTGCNGQWHMLTMTYDGAVKKLYFDGELEKSDEIAITTGLRPTAAFRLFRDGYVGYEFSAVEASLSDFRIYSTPLLDTDIKQLYNMSMKVDKSSSIHTEELIETSSNIWTRENLLKYRKSGNSAQEIFYKNGKSYIKTWPAQYHQNITIDDAASSCVLYQEFKPNTQYVFDMWIDSSESTSLGGFNIFYTDGTSSNALQIPANGNDEWVHKQYISDSGKTILRMAQRYGTNTPICTSLDSYIGPLDTCQIEKTAQVKATTFSEDSSTAKILKSGYLRSSQFIER